MFQDLVQAIVDAGGQPFIVGGYVRDQQLRLPSKDFDIEVFNLPADRLMEVLSPFGTVNLVGESFGVVKVRTPEGGEFDFSLPRRESKNGRGHTGFLIKSDPFMSPKEAASRRDFTFNALMMDPLTNEIHDFYDGLIHLKQRRLVATSEKFVEDPLRVLRGMQFAARFGMYMDTATMDMCRAVSSEFKYLTIERIWGEWYKMVTKGSHFEMAMNVLLQTAWIEHFPSWNRFYNEQHTLFQKNIGAAEHVAIQSHDGDYDQAVMVLATMLSEFDGAEAALTEISGGRYPDITNKVLKLVNVSFDTYSVADIRRAAFKMSPATIREYLAIQRERGTSHHFQEQIVMTKASEGGVMDGPLPPILSGKHLIANGHKPGPAFGRFIAMAYDAQMRSEFQDETGAVEWMHANQGLLV